MLVCLSEPRGCLAPALELLLKSGSLEPGGLQMNHLRPSEPALNYLVGANFCEMFPSGGFAPLWAGDAKLAAAHSSGSRLADVCIIPSLLSLHRSGEQLFYDPPYS